MRRESHGSGLDEQLATSGSHCDSLEVSAALGRLEAMEDATVTCVLQLLQHDIQLRFPVPESTVNGTIGTQSHFKFKIWPTKNKKDTTMHAPSPPLRKPVLGVCLCTSVEQ